MTTGISQWVGMENTIAADDVSVFQIETVLGLSLDCHIDIDVAPPVEEGIDIVPVLDELPGSDQHFAVSTEDEDGEVSVNYFGTYRAASVFAGRTTDQVVGFEGLMA